MLSAMGSALLWARWRYEIPREHISGELKPGENALFYRCRGLCQKRNGSLVGSGLGQLIDPCQFRWRWKARREEPIFQRISVRTLEPLDLERTTSAWRTSEDQSSAGKNWQQCWRAICLLFSYNCLFLSVRPWDNCVMLVGCRQHEHNSDDVHSRCGSCTGQRTDSTARLRVRHVRLHTLRQPGRLAQVSAPRTDRSQRARHHRTTVLTHKQIHRYIPSTPTDQIPHGTHHPQLVSSQLSTTVASV